MNENLSLVTNFVLDNLDSKVPVVEGSWHEITEDEVLYNFKNHKDVKCLVLNVNGLAEVKTTSFTGKLSVPLVALDFAKTMDEFVCSACIVQFKENFSSFKQVKLNELQDWILSCKDGAFYANEKTRGFITAENVLNASLPDGVIAYIPDCVGLIPCKFDSDGKLLKFGLNMMMGYAVFANVEII